MSWFEIGRTVALGAVTITLSVSLISFNKVLMKPQHFPYAAPLALMHMGFCSTLAALLLGVAPSLFPSLTDPERKVPIDAHFITRGIAPIGVAFAANLVCANMAYKHLSVAFLQMMKETNVVLVYFLSLVAGLERFLCWHIQVIVFAVFAASLTVRGELHFSTVGFTIQASGQLFEASRIVAMGVLLSGKKLDALSCVLVLSPACFVILGGFLGVIAAMPDGAVPESLALPTGDKLYEYAPLLLLNCSLAFALNVSMTLMIKYTSAVSYIFMGVLKDVVAVCISVLVLKEEVSGLQCFAFGMEVCAVMTWSMLKTSPPQVQQRGLFGAVVALATGDTSDGAAKPLMGTKV